MSLLLAFAPFLLFAALTRVTTLAIAAGAAALAAASTVVRGRRRGVKLLEAGSVLLFGGLALVLLVLKPDWTLLTVRLIVDSGLMALVLASLALRRPFTLAYAREQVAPEFWSDPRFLAVSTTIAWVWAGAFAVMVAADIAMVFLPGLPIWIGIAATIGALYGAIRFTLWYPGHVRPATRAAS